MDYIAHEAGQLASETELPEERKQEFTKIVLKSEGGLVRPVANKLNKQSLSDSQLKDYLLNQQNVKTQIQ